MAAGEPGIHRDGLTEQILGLRVGFGCPQARQLVTAQPQVIGDRAAGHRAGIAQQGHVVDLAGQMGNQRTRHAGAELEQVMFADGVDVRPHLAAIATINQADEQFARRVAPVQHHIHGKIGIDRTAHCGIIDGGGRAKARARPRNDDPAAKARQAGLGQIGKAFAQIIHRGIAVARQRRADGDAGRALAGLDRWAVHHGAVQRDVTALDRDQQVVAVTAWFAVQLVRQRAFHQPVLPQRGRLVAPCGVKLHQKLMGKFMAGLDADQLPGQTGIAVVIGGHAAFQMVSQRLGQQGPQMRAFNLHPGLEHRGTGQKRAKQFTLPQIGRRQNCTCVRGTGGDQGPQGQGINFERAGPQRHAEAVGTHCMLGLRPQHLAQFFQRLAQAAARQIFGRRVPQQRGKLFAVHRRAGVQHQQAKQAPRLAGAKCHLNAG